MKTKKKTARRERAPLKIKVDYDHIRFPSPKTIEAETGAISLGDEIKTLDFLLKFAGNPNTERLWKFRRELEEMPASWIVQIALHAITLLRKGVVIEPFEFRSFGEDKMDSVPKIPDEVIAVFQKTKVGGEHRVITDETKRCCRALCQIAAESVAVLQRAVVELPLEFREIAKDKPWWPGMISGDRDVVARNEAILKLLQVGKALGKQSRQQSSETKETANNYARLLLSTIEGNRMWLSPHAAELEGSSLPDYVKQCVTLKPLSATNALEWWEVGKQFLLASIPKLKDVKELRRMVVTPEREQHVAWYESEWQSKILDKIHKAFLREAARRSGANPATLAKHS